MDFKSITGKLREFGANALEKAGPTFDTALTGAQKFTGEMLEKTADLSYDSIKNTPYYIKDVESFEKARISKNLVVFVVGKKEDAATKAIIGRLPILVVKAWQFSSNMKVIYAEESSDLTSLL